MKLKNFNEESSELLCSNVIIDDDITLTDEQHEGESLKSVIGKTDRRLDRLESNVKWIYENGGVGSGGSGGGGGSTKWHVKAMLGGTSLDTDKTISFTSGVGVYVLRIWIDGGSGEYNVSYQVNNVTQKVKLNVDNGWATEISLDLNENATIAIIAKDGIISREITGVRCIVKPYVFNALVVQKSDGKPYTSTGDIIISDAYNNGLILKSSYVIAVPFESEQCRYRWLQNGVYINGSDGQITQSTGDITYEVPKSLLDNINAGLYNYQLQITLLLTGDTDSVTINYNKAFNLIPDGLYLKVSPANENEIFYNSNTIEDPYCFSTNTKIGINVRIYNGLSPTGSWGNISWLVDGSEPDSECNGSITIQDGYTTTITTYFVNEGWNKITFSYMLNGESGESIVKYFYCQHLQTNYNWFFDNGTYNNNPLSRRYYIPLEVNPELERVHGINGPTNGLHIEKRKSDIETTSLEIIGNYDNIQYPGYNQMFNFGIQYSDINNTVNPIIKCYDQLNQEAIVIYQNKIEFKGQFSSSTRECNIFLHKEIDYNVDDNAKYHLLTINIGTCYSHDRDIYYDITTYIDGKTEGAVETMIRVSPAITRVELQNVNFSLNHFEISSWGEDTSRFVYDTDVCWYYNSFADRIGLPIDSNETDILTNMYQPDGTRNFTIDNQLVKVNTALPSNIAGKINVPIMVITCNREIAFGDNNTVFTWINGSYEPENVEGLGTFKLNIKKLEWCGGQNKELGEIKLQDENEVSLGDFQLKLQGTSTMKNKAKNFTLSVEPSNVVVQQGKSTLFSPNFVSSEASTFLPETAFTLKADDVDSSHSNNTSIGKFVNQNNKWEYLNMINLSSGVEDDIKTHVKQCLEGFSMLLFLNVDYKENNIDYTDCYYLGIYNFNLGRNSYFNLGYSDLTQLHCSQLDESALHNNGFAVCTADVTPVTGFIATEIQDNKPYWDFSQYDSTILFQLPNTNEKSDFMFGDFVTSSSTDPLKESTIQNLVKSIAGAGAYLFNYIDKERVACDTLLPDGEHWKAYHGYDINIDPETNKKIITTYVSDVTQQYKRQRLSDRSDWYLNPTPNPDNIVVNDVSNLINCIIDDIDNDKIAPLDYASVVYYYVTCMVFGLVDSVQKNLNIKTWSAGDNAKSGVFFYDMDTSLGRNNAGDKTAYFAFSDYWKTNLVKYDSNGDPTDDDSQAVRYVNEGIDNFRDTFLFENGVEGYDIPSSFLFAIAKYAYLDDTVSATFRKIFPQQIYAEWRNTNGVLSSANNFIDTYFASNLRSIPNFLISLNYRNKYLYGYDEDENKFLHSTRLHGTGVEETRDWLRGRLRILDAYFNITGDTSIITRNIAEPTHSVLIDNPDVNLLSDIFIPANSQQGIQRNKHVTFKVTAPDYSPLVVTVGSSPTWYIFEDSNVEYETFVKIDPGATIFGGSQLWRTLDSINGFVESRTGKDSAFVFRSNIIENMIGTSGKQGGNWLITGPALEEISLTSQDYGGTLDIDDKFYSIKTININRSKISLNINNCPVKTINASNVKDNANITITNCNELIDVNLSGSTLNDCNISPTWTDDLNFTNVYAKNITLTAKDRGVFTAKSNNNIEKCYLDKFEIIDIDDCKNLKELKVTSASPIIKEITITNCTSLTTLVLNACDNLEELNLYGCNHLESITIGGSSFNKLKTLGLGSTNISSITIGENVNDNTKEYWDFTCFPSLAKDDDSYVSFYGNKNVKRIKFDNSGNTDILLKKDPNVASTYSGCFANCTNLERIYGSFVIKCAYCFYLDAKFSIHGDNLSNVQWNGESVIDVNGRYKHPSEFTSNQNPETYWPRRNDINVTNMRVDTSSINGAFYGTKYTIFDVYYILYKCNANVKTMTSLFRGGTNADYGRFYWNNNVDNSPNVNMFNNCSGVTSIQYMFFACGNRNVIRLKSPNNNKVNVTQDNGLFSPLTSLQIFDRSFSSNNPNDGYYLCIDRFLFRRQDEQKYKITRLDGFYVKHIVDDINDYNVPPNTVETDTNLDRGHLSGFFTELSNISGECRGLFDYCDYIDFSSINNIPNGIKTLTSSFCGLYGDGILTLTNCFQSQTNIRNIYNSFCVTNKLNDTAPTIMLNNNTFSIFSPRANDNYPGLVNIGYYSTGTGYRNANTIFESSFSGFNKIIDGNGFPYDIFSNLPNLEMASCVFMDAWGTISNLKLPGNLFANNHELKNCSGIFYNLQNEYSISETYDITYNIDDTNYDNGVEQIIATYDSTDSSKSMNFINCTKIEDVSYMFGSDEKVFDPSRNKGIEYKPKLSGMIPRNLFWHGLDNVNTRVEEIWGKNTGDDHHSHGYRYIIVPYTTISNIKGCFKHCNCTRYTENKWTTLKEPNSTYSPFDIITDSSGNRIGDNQSKDEFKWTADWFYDGSTNYDNIVNNDIYLSDSLNWNEELLDTSERYESRSGKNVLDGDTNDFAVQNYICPPDLLRYCKKDADVSELFAYSGTGEMRINNQMPEVRNIGGRYAFGITGRICPYLLKPVSETKSVEGMFRSCKKLSYVHDRQENIDFLLPSNFFDYTPYVSVLDYMFYCTVQPHQLNMSNTFSALRQMLSVKSIFANCYWEDGSSNDRTIIADVFTQNQIGALKGAFEIEGNQNTAHIRKQYVEFNNVFPKKYNSSVYNKDDYSHAFYGYEYGFVQHESTHTVYDSAITQNYTTIHEQTEELDE